MTKRYPILVGAWLLTILMSVSLDVSAQRKTKKKPAAPEPPSELEKLREDFVKATNEYKASLGKLLAIYESNVTKAEEKVTQAKQLLAEGLIARAQVEESEHALALAQQKVAETKRQMTNADAQVAGVLVENEADQ